MSCWSSKYINEVICLLILGLVHPAYRAAFSDVLYQGNALNRFQVTGIPAKYSLGSVEEMSPSLVANGKNGALTVMI